MGVINLFCFVHRAINGLPSVSHHASVSELGGGTVVWPSKKGHSNYQKLTVIRVRKRERSESLLERFTWCRRSDAFRKQTPKNSLLLMVNDMNGRAERRVD